MQTQEQCCAVVQGRKEDLGWAVLTAAATTLAVKFAEWAFDSLRERVEARKKRDTSEKHKPGEANRSKDNKA